MAILITYPQKKIAPVWQQRLAAIAPVIYYPFRELTFKPLTKTAQHTLQQADYVVLTSAYAAACLVEHYAQLVQQAQLIVLSTKLAQQVAGCGQSILVAPQPHQQALVTYLEALRQPQQKVVALVGNLTKLKVRASWNLLPIYQNQWSATAAQQAQTDLAPLQFDRVLVTSPSNFTRFWQIHPHEPAPRFVALGATTAQVLRQQGLAVQVPSPQEHLLAAALALLAAPEFADD